MLHNIIANILFTLFFFLPAGVANSAPVIAAKIPGLKNFNQPIDFGLKFRGIRVFGDHKTIRGYLAGILISIVLVYIEKLIYMNSEFIQEISYVDYSETNVFIFGFLLGFGALLGDSIKSFFKRRVGIKPGKSWFPFDQIDYILGGLLFISFYVNLPVQVYLYTLIVWFLLHLITVFIGYHLGIRKDPI